MLKASFNRGRNPHLSFWRDSNKNEIDFVIEKGLTPHSAIEVKSSTTFKSNYFNTLTKIAPTELGLNATSSYVVYAGEQELHGRMGNLISFANVASLV